MKSIKLALWAVVTLAFGISSARAGIGIVTNYSKLTVSAIVTTNGNASTNGSVFKQPVSKVKLGNKQLLALFGQWAGTDSWPVGAQLAVGWDPYPSWNGDILVVDKTGTNVLYDASVSSNNYFYVTFNSYYGAYTESQLNATNAAGYDNITQWYSSELGLYDGGLPYTDILATGGDTQVFKQSWSATAYTTWSDSESALMPTQGQQVYLDNEAVSFSATVKAVGKGKGENPYWY